MTITIFEKNKCKGAKKVLSGNIADLKGKNYDKPSSIRMSSDKDTVLLFKNDDWHGGVMYLRGEKTISDLGKKDKGGKFGFGNSIRSVRCTPFTLNLNITVVKDGTDLPGNWTSNSQARAEIDQIIANANNFYKDRQALLRLKKARITFRNNDGKFILGRKEGVPNDWTRRGEVDVIFIDRFKDTKHNTIGKGKFPCTGQTIKLASKTDDGKLTYDSDDLTYIMIHEAGHYLGLSHKTADDKKINLMFNSKQGNYWEKALKPSQIEEMHQRLARNISRRGDRN